MIFAKATFDIATTKSGFYLVLGVLCGWAFLYNDKGSPLHELHDTLTTLWMWLLFAVLVAILVTVLPLLLLAAYLDGPDYFLGLVFLVVLTQHIFSHDEYAGTSRVVYVSGFLSLFLLHYWKKCQKPTVIARRGGITRHIMDKCQSLHRVIYPPIWCYNPHLQLIPFMIIGLLAEKPTWTRIERISGPDSGDCTLYWADPPHDKDAPDTPIVLFMHGVMCDAGDIPGTSFIHLATRRFGFRATVLERRGHGINAPLKKLNGPRPVYFNLYSHPGDLHRAVDSITSRYPRAPIIGIGVSSGAAPLVRYAADLGVDCKLDAVIAVAGAPDIETCHDRLHPFYSNIMLSRAKDYFINANIDVLRDFDSDGTDAALLASSLQTFVDSCHKFAGFETMEEYYTAINPTSADLLSGVKVPTLFLHAADDTLSVQRNIDELMYLFRKSDYFGLANTATGGHCPFFDGMFYPRNWAEQAALEFVKELVRLRNEDLSHSSKSFTRG